MWSAIASTIAGAFAFAAVVYQTRVHRDNRSDHAETAQQIKDLRTDIRDVHDDVKDVRSTLRQHANRLFHLEHPEGDT